MDNKEKQIKEDPKNPTKQAESLSEAELDKVAGGGGAQAGTPINVSTGPGKGKSPINPAHPNPVGPIQPTSGGGGGGTPN
jgi:hypothetical protein